MSSAAIQKAEAFTAIEAVLVGGDLTPLTPEQRVNYYNRVCESVGLNPLTRPFDYLRLNNKLILYANKNCADQLMSTRSLSVEIPTREPIQGVFVVTARVKSAGGEKYAVFEGGEVLVKGTRFRITGSHAGTYGPILDSWEIV